ncbi:hypothetical protein Tco_1392277 [Tanacetum coccineum]
MPPTTRDVIVSGGSSGGSGDDQGVVSDVMKIFISKLVDNIHTVIMKMVPHKAFACRCGAGDVILRELHQPHTRERGTSRLLVGSPRALTTPSYSPGPSTTPNYSPRPSTPPSYTLGPSRNAECSNYKLLLGKIKVLDATLEMYMHPENHT